MIYNLKKYLDQRNWRWIPVFIVVPPVDIQLEEVSRSEILKNSTKISLLCTTGVSNPISNITWDGLDDIENTLLTTETKNKEFGGYQTSQVRFHGWTQKVAVTGIQPLTTFFSFIFLLLSTYHFTVGRLSNCFFRGSAPVFCHQFNSSWKITSISVTVWVARPPIFGESLLILQFNAKQFHHIILFVKIDPRHVNIQWPSTQSSRIFVKIFVLDCCTISNLKEIITHSPIA